MQKESRLRMEFTNAAAWLQTPQIPDLHDERTSATPDDWKEHNANVQGGINDLLTDIPGEHDSLTPAISDAFSPCSCPSSLPSHEPALEVRQLSRCHLLYSPVLHRSRCQSFQRRAVWRQCVAIHFRPATPALELFLPEWRNKHLLTLTLTVAAVEHHGYRVRRTFSRRVPILTTQH